MGDPLMMTIYNEESLAYTLGRGAFVVPSLAASKVGKLANLISKILRLEKLLPDEMLIIVAKVKKLKPDQLSELHTIVAKKQRTVNLL